MQDWLLGSERFRALVLRAFRRRYDAIIEEALAPQAASPHTFDTLDYYVDANARSLLQFAGLHALSVQLTADEALAPSQLLPCVSRVLLQTEEKSSGRCPRRGAVYVWVGGWGVGGWGGGGGARALQAQSERASAVQ
jgi:hypothetical protein